MNKVVLAGRLTRDPDVRYTQNNVCVARFSLAVDRRFKQDGQPDADFPNIVAFNKTAEFIEKYFCKGMKMNLSGRIQTGSYTNRDGQKVYTTDVVAEEVEFGESKAASGRSGSSGGSKDNSSAPPASTDGWLNVPEGIDDEELPF
ncbi:MAG: single-stranded DNA-binding protein [Clostridiales bacterium]|nr:single-stranded DNA-binding protein [Clostridiales bacterium]